MKIKCGAVESCNHLISTRLLIEDVPVHLPTALPIYHYDLHIGVDKMKTFDLN